MKMKTLQGAVVTPSQFKRAEHLVQLFKKPEYSSLRRDGEDIQAAINECRAFQQASSILCNILSHLAPGVEMPRSRGFIKSMRLAKKNLAGLIECFKDYP